MNTATLEPPAEARNIEVIEGVHIDADTGEIITTDIVDEGEQDLVEKLVRKCTRLDAVGNSMAMENATAKATVERLRDKYQAMMESDPDYLEAAAIMNHTASQAERAERARTAITKFYEDLFRRFAEKMLGNGKERTWRSPFGSIELRKLPEEVVVPESPDWKLFDKLAPDSVKRSVLLTPLKKLDAKTLSKLGVELKAKPDKVTVLSAFQKGGK